MDRQGLRSGYTTGSCASAGAQGAALAIVGRRTVEEVVITLPRGERVRFALHSCVRHSATSAECSVIKDAGDDPDVTHGAEIFTRVDLEAPPGLRYRAGKGVGTVTKAGLELGVGEPAINPVPRRMIRQALEEVLGQDWGRVGATVTISIPNGEVLAKETLNARLGILGGLSILGTTGIVEPYSHSAFKVSILKAIRVARVNGCTHLVLTPGGKSEGFAQRTFRLPEESFIEVGDFVAQAMAYCRRYRPSQVTFGALPAKFSKVAAGQLETHSRDGEVDFGFLADVGAVARLPQPLLADIRAATLAREVFAWVKKEPAQAEFFRLLSLAAQRSLAGAAQGAFAVETVLFDFDGAILARAGESDEPDARTGRAATEL
jgi:cobalt-precorrin-5B (C1)-methyltransferase